MGNSCRLNLILKYSKEVVKGSSVIMFYSVKNLLVKIFRQLKVSSSAPNIATFLLKIFNP